MYEITKFFIVFFTFILYAFVHVYTDALWSSLWIDLRSTGAEPSPQLMNFFFKQMRNFTLQRVLSLIFRNPIILL